MLTFDEIKELIDLVSERGLEGIEVERAGFKLRIDGHRAVAAPVAAPAPAPSAPPPAPSEAAPAAAPSAPGPAPTPASGPAVPDGAQVVPSPIVGTFYASPSPEADPYVRVGDRVSKGQVLCIVEAMKLMNEIESDVDGEVVAIYPKNAEPVEYGEPLFAIKAG